jgi:hypothetical protein
MSGGVASHPASKLGDFDRVPQIMEPLSADLDERK